MGIQGRGVVYVVQYSVCVCVCAVLPIRIIKCPDKMLFMRELCPAKYNYGWTFEFLARCQTVVSGALCVCVCTCVRVYVSLYILEQ